jgi:hypothetical protein
MSSFTARPLYPRRKGPQYTFDSTLGGSQSRLVLFGEDRIFPTLGIDPRYVPRPTALTTLLCFSLNFPIFELCHNLKLFIITLIVIQLNCKWVITQWQWYYNKTQYKNAHHRITQPHLDKTQHTKLHKRQITFVRHFYIMTNLILRDWTLNRARTT